jgi:hypothetical protein
MTEKRQAVFIGNLFINKSKNDKLYLKGSVKVGEEEVKIFGHYVEKPSKKDPSIIVKSFALEIDNSEDLPTGAKGKVKKETTPF